MYVHIIYTLSYTHTHTQTHTHTGSRARPVGAAVIDAEAAGVASTGTPFNSFTGTKVQILLYWYKSTNAAVSDAEAAEVASTGTPFTSFTGTTKVQILVQKYKY